MYPNVRELDAQAAFIGPRIGERTIEQQIYDALESRINLSGLTLEVTPGRQADIRLIRLYDGYVGVGSQINIYNFVRDKDRLCDVIAHQLVMAFAQERYLRK